jgi:hypothetical protein
VSVVAGFGRRGSLADRAGLRLSRCCRRFRVVVGGRGAWPRTPGAQRPVPVQRAAVEGAASGWCGAGTALGGFARQGRHARGDLAPAPPAATPSARRRPVAVARAALSRHRRCLMRRLRDAHRHQRCSRDIADVPDTPPTPTNLRRRARRCAPGTQRGARRPGRLRRQPAPDGTLRRHLRRWHERSSHAGADVSCGAFGSLIDIGGARETWQVSRTRLRHRATCGGMSGAARRAQRPGRLRRPPALGRRRRRRPAPTQHPQRNSSKNPASSCLER